MRRFFIEYFSFTRSETRISLVVFSLLIASLIFRIIISNMPAKSLVDDELMDELAHLTEEMELREAEKSALKPGFILTQKENEKHELKPVFFDPNTVDSATMSEMGLSKFIISNIRRYRNAGGRFSKNTDLLRIYGMNDSLYNILSGYIIMAEIPAPVKNEDINDLHHDPNHLLISLNTADSVALLRINKIGPVLSSRIIRFRNLLGGFIAMEQVMEVFGMDSIIYESIRNSVFIDTLKISKLDINSIEEWDLRRHPYISPQMARDIINYRKLSGKIESPDHLFSQGILSEDELARIIQYLSCE